MPVKVRILILIFCALVVRAEAVTVEAILRAFQERYEAVRDAPLQWDDELPAYPTDGTITTVEDAIKHLNRASAVFDQLLQPQYGEVFIAYDPVNKVAVNPQRAVSEGSWVDGEYEGADYWKNEDIRGGSWESKGMPGTIRIKPSGLDLPSVGTFDLTNWRWKAVVLASNIRQLNAVRGSFSEPARKLASVPYAVPSAGPDVPSEWEWTPEEILKTKLEQFFCKYNKDVQVDFPHLSLANEGGPETEMTPRYEFTPSDSDIYGFSWSVRGITYKAGGDEENYSWPENFSMPQSWLESPFYADQPEILQKPVSFHEQFKGSLRWTGFSTLPNVWHRGQIAEESVILKAPVVFSHGDLTERISKLTNGALPLGAFSPLPAPEELQNLSTDSMERALQRMGIDPDALNLVSTRVPAAVDSREFAIPGRFPVPPGAPAVPVDPEEYVFSPVWYPTLYCFQFPEAAIQRRSLFSAPYRPQYYRGEFRQPYQAMWVNPGYADFDSVRRAASSHQFEVEFLGLALPEFTDLPVTDFEGYVPYGLGDVELTHLRRDFVRIHAGRGRTDKNQVAYLTARPDGFGSLVFHGSPAEFDVLYENNHTAFNGTPFGGPTFDSVAEFSPELKKRVTWPNRFHYMADWFAPRLRQVRGGDVLVDIEFLSDYKRKLRFFWATGEEEKVAGFFVTQGAPFKEVVLENPTLPDEFPEHRHRLHLLDGTTRHWIVDYREAVKLDGTPPEENYTGGRQDRLYFKGGPTPEAEEWQQTFVFEHQRDPQQVVSYADYPAPGFVRLPAEQQSLGKLKIWNDPPGTGTDIYTELDYGRWPQSELEIPTYVEAEANGETRRIDFSWNGGDRTETWTGSAQRWADAGRIRVFDLNAPTGESIPISDKRSVAGKEVEASASWDSDANMLSINTSVEQASVLGSLIEYETLDKVNVYADSLLQSTQEYQPLLTPASWSKEYTNNYREKLTVSFLDGITKRVSESGWGVPMNLGTKTTVEQNRFGGLKSHLVQSGAVTLASSTVPEGQSTPWGAPLRIDHLRGEPDKFTYVETGSNWGTLLTHKNPFTVQATYAGHDWLSRPGTLNTGFNETLTADYGNSYISKVTSSAGHENSSTRTPFGDLLSSESTYGADFSYSRNPAAGSGSLTVDNRSTALEIDPSGAISRIATGLGARGDKFTIGVENGDFYTEVTPLRKDDVERGGSIRTYYDSQGRVRKIRRPSHNGTGPIEENWVYDDIARKVTYIPPAGPLAQTVVQELHETGSPLTLTVGGVLRQKVSRSIEDGAIVERVLLNNDSEIGGSGVEEEVSKQTINPTSGEALFTPWNLAGRALSISSPAPGATGDTIVKEGGRPLLTVQQAHGLPSTASGNPDGRAVNLTAARENGRLTGMSGTVGGQPAGFQLNTKRQVSQITSGGSNLVLGYGAPGAGGFEIAVQDTVQGTTSSLTLDKSGDFVGRVGDGDIDLSASTADDAFTSVTTLLGSVQHTSNFYGESMGKVYTGGIQESITRHPDGTIDSWSVGSESTGYSYEQNPTKVTAARGDGSTTQTTYFQAGPRSSVVQTGAGQNEGREFKYRRLALKEEHHINGPLVGWKLELIQDDMGRLETIRATGPGGSRQFTLGYDVYSRLETSSGTWNGQNYSAMHQRNAAGLVNSITRPGLVTAPTYDPINNRLLSVTNNAAGGQNYNYTYPTYDARHRIRDRVASVGTSWTSLGYDSKDRLRDVVLSGYPNRVYNYHDRNNRTDQGLQAGHVINGLDQIEGRTLGSRGFGVFGSVYPGSQAEFYHNLDPVWSGLSPDPQTGAFFRWYDVPVVAGNTAPVRVDGVVRGTRPGLGGSAPAVAEQSIHLMVPPSAEDFDYDDAGRLTKDAFWTYQWDQQGRLIGMTRRQPMTSPEIASETLGFAYDADGRRIRKRLSRTYTDPNKPYLEETSTVLWCGWLPLCEVQDRHGIVQRRRWFQWGADLSGTLDGAGGIGGLVAIHEETGSGQWKRTLLPVTDGLGNITAVLDAANRKTVARYEFGPFGEPLGQSGEPDACPFRWQTKWHDAESEHYYFGYRHYDPRLGRWLSRDPLGEAGGFNLYAYCGNDPVNRHDPLGLQTSSNSNGFRIAYGGYSYPFNTWFSQNGRPQTMLSGGFYQNQNGTLWRPTEGGLWIETRDSGGEQRLQFVTGPTSPEQIAAPLTISPLQLRQWTLRYGAYAELSGPSASTNGLATLNRRMRFEARQADYYFTREGMDWLAQTYGGQARWTSRTAPWQRRTFQRSDIDWNLIRPEGAALAGLSNLTAARRGYAPVRINPVTGRPEDVVLHHLNQDPRGSIAELWRSMHGRVPHQMDPPGNWREANPEWAKAWNREQSAYWRWRVGDYHPASTTRLLLPGDILNSPIPSLP